MNMIIDEAFNDGCDYVFNTNLDDYYHPTRIEKQIEKILNKQGSVNGFMNYLFKIKNEDAKYFLKIGNKLLKFIIGHLSEIGNPKSLKFINLIFDMG